MAQEMIPRRLFVACAFLILLLYGGLIVSLFYFFEWPLVSRTLLSPRTLFSVRLSLVAATSATILSLAVAVPAAYALSRYEFRAKRWIEAMLEFPLVVSPAALGAMLLIFFQNPLGSWIQKTWVSFVFTPHGIVLAQFVTTAGLATRLLKAVMDEIPPRYEMVARTLGANPLVSFLTITLPMSKRGIIAATVLTWAKAMGEFGASITIGGSMAMRTETLPIAIFMRLSTADIEGSVILILILISIGLIPLFIVRELGRARLNA